MTSSFNFSAKEFVPSFAKRTPAPAAAASTAVPAATTQPASTVPPAADAPSPPPRVPPAAAAAAPTASKLSSAASEFVPKKKPELPWKPPASVDPPAAPSTPPTVPAFPDVGVPTTAPLSSLHFDAPSYIPKFLTSQATAQPTAGSSAATAAEKTSAAKKPGSKPAGKLSSAQSSKPAPTLLPSAAKPAPLSTTTISTPTSASTSQTFASKWMLHFIDRVADTFDPYLIFEISNIEEFWRTFNNIPAPSISPAGSSYFLFRKGIEPKWEDPANKTGGSYSVTFKPHDANSALDDVWIRLCCRAVGESWQDPFRDHVTGILVKVREKRIVVQVWTDVKLEFFQLDVLSCIADVMPSAFIDFISHEDAQKRAEAFDTKKPVPKRK